MAFLSEAELAAGRNEWRQWLAEATQAPYHLCRETLAWARGHPEDPRVADALHLAGRSTRWTLAISKLGPRTTGYPKQAFQFLHTRYPKSDGPPARPIGVERTDLRFTERA